MPEKRNCKLLSQVQLFVTPRTIPYWNSLGQNTGMGSLSLLQGVFPTQGLNPGLPHCGWILYQLSHQGSPRTLEWVVYPFSRGSSWPGIEPGSLALHTDSLPTELWGKPLGCLVWNSNLLLLRERIMPLWSFLIVDHQGMDTVLSSAWPNLSFPCPSQRHPFTLCWGVSAYLLVLSLSEERFHMQL